MEHYIEKHQSLVDRGPAVDSKLLYQRFIAGLSAGRMQLLAGEVGRRELSVDVEFAEMKEHLSLNRRECQCHV